MRPWRVLSTKTRLCRKYRSPVATSCDFGGREAHVRNPRVLRASERSFLRACVTSTLVHTETFWMPANEHIGAIAPLSGRLVRHVVNRHRLVVALVLGHGVTHEDKLIVEAGGNVF